MLHWESEVSNYRSWVTRCDDCAEASRERLCLYAHLLHPAKAEGHITQPKMPLTLLKLHCAASLDQWCDSECTVPWEHCAESSVRLSKTEALHIRHVLRTDNAQSWFESVECLCKYLSNAKTYMEKFNKIFEGTKFVFGEIFVSNNWSNTYLWSHVVVFPHG